MAYVELTAPEQFKFVTPGDKIEGVLLGASRIRVGGKPTVQYMVGKHNGNRFTFLATADLVQKITREHIGHPIYVEFTGYRDDVEKQGNKMRTFKVMVDQDAAVDPLHITDDDIPF